MNFELDDYVVELLYTYDDVDERGKRLIEELFSRFGINNGQDTDKVIEDCKKSDMTMGHCKIVIEKLGEYLVD